MENSAENDLSAQQWATQMFNVLTLDGIWTNSLSARHMSPTDMQDAADLGEVLLSTWSAATDVTAHKFIRDYVHVHLPEIEPLVSGPGGPLFELSEEEPAGLTGLANRAIDELFAAHDLEADALRKQIDRLHSNTWTPGDLSRQTKKKALIVTSIVLLCVGLPDVATALSLLLAWPDAPGG